MTEIEAKKEYLNEYKKIYYKLRSLDDQKRSLIETMEAAKAIEYSDMPKGSKQSDLSDYIVKLDHIYTEIGDKQIELLHKRAEIEALIAELPDGIESSVLHKRYIEFKKWEQICVDIDFEWRQTHRIHSKALRHLVVPKNEITKIIDATENMA